MICSEEISPSYSLFWYLAAPWSNPPTLLKTITPYLIHNTVFVMSPKNTRSNILRMSIYSDVQTNDNIPKEI